MRLTMFFNKVRPPFSLYNPMSGSIRWPYGAFRAKPSVFFNVCVHSSKYTYLMIRDLPVNHFETHLCFCVSVYVCRTHKEFSWSRYAALHKQQYFIHSIRTRINYKTIIIMYLLRKKVILQMTYHQRPCNSPKLYFSSIFSAFVTRKVLSRTFVRHS